ncbi:MAG: hypothetical protein WCE90_02615 [Candidatus Zixiibacteriota bacterium]
MTKKLFLVLVVVSAVLMCFSMVMAAKSIKHSIDSYGTRPFEYAKPLMKGTVQAVPAYTGPNRGTPTHKPVHGTPTEILVGPVDRTKSLCDLSRAGHWAIPGWMTGVEHYAHYEDPAAFGCAFPFRVTEITFGIMTAAADSFSASVSVNDLDLSVPACPKPGSDICVSLTYTINIPGAGYWLITLPLDTPCCVYGPYFAEFHLPDPLPGGEDAITDNAPVICQSYNDWGSGWKDLVAGYGFPGGIELYSKGLSGQNSQCPPQPTPPCRLQLDNGPAWRFNITNAQVGYGMVNYFDAKNCGATNYPFKIDSVLFRISTSSVTFPYDVTIAFYDLKPALDSCGGPGALLYSQVYTITGAPSWKTVPLNQPFCAHKPFFGGVFMASSSNGPFSPNFSDTILTPPWTSPADTCRSWAKWGGTWYNWSGFLGYPADVARMLFRVNGTPGYTQCPEPACTSSTTTLSDYIAPVLPAWRIPHPSGRNYPNQEFTVPLGMVAGARLDEVHLAFWDMFGTPSPTVYIWSDDGTGVPYDPHPPNTALASYNIANADVQIYPNWQVVSTWQQGLYFNSLENFHVGYSFSFANPADTLKILGDDYTLPHPAGARASYYFPSLSTWYTTADYYGLTWNFIVEAVMCPVPPGESTFVMQCASTGPVSPGDANVHVGNVTVAKIMNYNIPVTLSLLSVTPPANITATFNPNGVNPPFISAVSVSVDPTVAYGNYTLSIQALGADGQAKTCDLPLVVQAPYDEAVVNFYHGTQRTSNFGAVADDAKSDNFIWYGTNYLFDGSFMSAVPGTPHGDHIAMDLYNCVHHGFSPPQHMGSVVHVPWCPGSVYQENYGQVAYSNFYTEESAISCEHDSVFVIGLSDVVSTDFSIKIRIIYNPTPTPIPVLNTGLWEDWDVTSGGSYDPYHNSADMDTLHNFIYQWFTNSPTLVFGMLYSPFYNEKMFNMVAARNPVYVWPDTGFCAAAPHPEAMDSLYLLLTRPGWTPAVQPDTDYSLLSCPPPFALNHGEERIQIWFDFGRNTADGTTWQQWYHRLLRYAGFYRGDVNANDNLELPALDVSDLVYLRNYLFEHGPAPMPFADQGNVDGKGPLGGPIDTVCPKNNVDAQDLIYLVNYVFKSGPAPVDYVRFIPSFWSRTSLFTNPTWH